LARVPADFGLTRREASFLRGLKPAWRIQRFLDSIDYDVKGEGCRSPRRVLRDRKAQCMDGALFAAAALRLQGYRPRSRHELRRVVFQPAPAEDAAPLLRAR